MSFSATFYTFQKRINSTKQPSGSGTSYDVILKDGCSIINPELQLDLGLGSSPATYNYCYICQVHGGCQESTEVNY